MPAFIQYVQEPHEGYTPDQAPRPLQPGNPGQGGTGTTPQKPHEGYTPDQAPRPLQPGNPGQGSGQDGSGQEGSGQEGSGQGGSGQDGSGQDGSGQDGSGQDGSGQGGSGQDGSGQGGSGQGGSGQDGSGQEGSGQDGSGQGGSGQEGSGQGEAGNGSSKPDTYTIKKGDTLSDIANEYNKNRGANEPFMSIEALAVLNGIKNANEIVAGGQLTMTADKATVDDCNSQIQKFANDLEQIGQDFNLLDPTQADSDNDGQLDQEFANIKNNVKNNIGTIVRDAREYSRWLSQLSTALEDTTLWSNQVMNSDMTIKDTKGI